MGKATFTPAQAAFRFYQDGTESGSAVLANQDTNVTVDVTSGDVLVHLRIRIQETGGADGLTTDDWILRMSKNGGAYAAIFSSSSTDVYAGVSASITDNEATTSRLTGGSGSFVAGVANEGNVSSPNLQLTANNHTELLFVLLVPNGGTNGDTYDFQIQLNNANLSTYTVTPRLTVAKTPLYTQAEAAFYEDGTEAGSTVIDAGADSITRDVTSDSNILLRVRLQNTNAAAGASTDDYQLQYEVNDSGTYSNVNIGSISQTTSAGSQLKLAGGGAATQAISQSFTTGAAFTLDHLVVSLLKIGTPTDNVYAEIRSGSTTGTLIATSNNVDASTVPSTTTRTTFTFSSPPSLSAATVYYIVFERSGTGSVGNSHCLEFLNQGSTGAEYSGGTVWYDILDTGWTQDTNMDLYFELGPIPVVSFASTNLTDGNATTNRLGSGTGSFVAGEISEDGLVDNLAITASNYTELLYALTIESTAVADADTLDFRVLRNGATTGMTYTVVPRITVSASSSTNLVVQDATHSHSVDNVVLTQKHTLAVADTSHAHSVDNAVLTQKHTLVVADSSHGHTSEAPTLIESTALVVQDSTHSHSVDNVVLTQKHTLTVADASHAHSADNVVLTQKHTLVVADTSHGHTVDNVVVTQKQTLAVADASHAHSVDSPTLTQKHTLVVADATHSHTSDNLALTQKHTLVVADALHDHTVDNVVIVVGGVTLTVQDSTHAHSVDNTTLTQKHTITVADAAHSHSVDNTVLTQKHTLATQDATHGHSSDNIDLVENLTLVVADSSHTHSADNITLTQKHALAVADSSHAHTAENVDLQVGSLTLTVQDSTHAHATDGVVLAQKHTLTVQDALHGGTASLTPRFILIDGKYIVVRVSNGIYVRV